jgi:hypothetical protein
MRVAGEEVFGLAVKVCEITATSAGDENLFANTFREIDEGNSTAALAGFDRAHQSGGAGSENYDVEFVFQVAP